MNARLRGALPLVAAALLLLVPYRDLLTGRVPAARDLLFYFYPAKAALAESLRSGLVPWIDRYRWGGLPLLGAPGAAPFDPGNLLFAALPLGAAASAWILLRLLTGLSGFYLFGRRIGLSAWGAAAGALLYSFSGPTVSVAPFLGASAAHSFLPWVAVLALEARRSPSPAAAARLGVVAGLILVSGAPEYVLYAGLVVAALVVGPPVDGSRESAAPFSRTAIALGGSALLAAALAAPALLGGFATISASSRTAEGGFGLSAAGKGALPPARLVELLSDGLLADWTRFRSRRASGRTTPTCRRSRPGASRSDWLSPASLSAVPGASGPWPSSPSVFFSPSAPPRRSGRPRLASSPPWGRSVIRSDTYFSPASPSPGSRRWGFARSKEDPGLLESRGVRPAPRPRPRGPGRDRAASDRGGAGGDPHTPPRAPLGDFSGSARRLAAAPRVARQLRSRPEVPGPGCRRADSPRGRKRSRRSTLRSSGWARSFPPTTT